MKLYADAPSYRRRQVVSDLALAVWIVIWVRVGTAIHGLVERLAEPGRRVEEAGRGFAGTVGDLGADAAGVPLVAETLQRPFDSIAGAGRALQRAGAGQQDVIHSLALWLGILLALIPISYVLYRYVPYRLRWVREASAARRIEIDAADLRLFALRAVATKPLYELAAAVEDPAAALEAGDYEALAALELASLGLTVRDPR